MLLSLTGVISRRPVAQLGIGVIVDLFQCFENSDTVREDTVRQEEGVEEVDAEEAQISQAFEQSLR